VLGFLAGVAPLRDYITAPDHYVSHVPLAILAVGLVLLGGGLFFLGILLHALNWRLIELHSVVCRQRDQSD